MKNIKFEKKNIIDLGFHWYTRSFSKTSSIYFHNTVGVVKYDGLWLEKVHWMSNGIIMGFEI